jgi:hypothetical protein
VNLPLEGSYFATGRRIEFGWHQDHESFFAIQNHYDYLNFYNPYRQAEEGQIQPVHRSLRCTRGEPANLPEAGPGRAARFARIGDQRIAFLDDTGSVHLMKKDLDCLALAPELNPGDLLLLRGDIIHRTQDTDTERVSLSFRAANAETLVRRTRLADGGLKKAWMMMNNAETYERMFHAFDVAGKQALAFVELQQTMSSLPYSDEMGRKRFFQYLLRQKRRERVLFRFFRTSLMTVLASLAASVSERRRQVKTPKID